MSHHLIRWIGVYLLAAFATNAHTAPTVERCAKELQTWTSFVGDVGLWRKSSAALRDTMRVAGIGNTNIGKKHDPSIDTHFITVKGRSDGLISAFDSLFIDGGTLPYKLTFYFSTTCVSIEGLIKAINRALPRAKYEPNSETPEGHEHMWLLHTTDKNEENDIIMRLLSDTKSPKTPIIEILANEMMLEGLGGE